MEQPGVTAFLTSTPEVTSVNINGVPVPLRIWVGKTAGGTGIEAFVFSIVPTEEESVAALARELPNYFIPSRQSARISVSGGPMSQPNRLIAYTAAEKLRALGYRWDENAKQWVGEPVSIEKALTEERKRLAALFSNMVCAVGGAFSEGYHTATKQCAKVTLSGE